MCFLNERHFLEGTKFFVKKVSFRKKNKLDERNGPFREMKKWSFLKKERKKRNWKILMFFTERTNFLNDFEKKTIVFYWTNDIFWTNDKIENERNQCFWMIDKNGSFTKAKRTKWKSRTFPSLYVAECIIKKSVFSNKFSW